MSVQPIIHWMIDWLTLTSAYMLRRIGVVTRLQRRHKQFAAVQPSAIGRPMVALPVG